MAKTLFIYIMGQNCWTTYYKFKFAIPHPTSQLPMSISEKTTQQNAHRSAVNTFLWLPSHQTWFAEKSTIEFDDVTIENAHEPSFTHLLGGFHGFPSLPWVSGPTTDDRPPLPPHLRTIDPCRKAHFLRSAKRQSTQMVTDYQCFTTRCHWLSMFYYKMVHTKNS